MKERSYFRCLTIAGSDSGGGAGIQADLKTFAALGCYGTTAITAITAQDTQEVHRVALIEPALICAQIDAVIDDIGLNAAKIGMLGEAANIHAVSSSLRKDERWRSIPIVLDPVMFSKSGHALLSLRAIEVLRTELVCISSVFTPNLPEASTLIGRVVQSRAEMERAALELLDWGPAAVLIKGGHSDRDDSDDCLAIQCNAGPPRMMWLAGARVSTQNTHGTGCTLSSAIAAFLARGESLELAVRYAKTYLTHAIRAGSEFRIGQGHGPVQHFPDRTTLSF